MSVQFEDPRGKFLRRVSRLEAKAHNPLNAPLPEIRRGTQESWIENKVSAFLLGLLVLITVRVVMFHNPVLVEQARNLGMLPGMAGAYTIPLTAALLTAWFAGHFQQDYWVFSLAGIGLALFFEPFIMLLFPDIWGLVYSAEYVAFVGEENGSLRSWHDGNTVPLLLIADTPAAVEPVAVVSNAATSHTAPEMAPPPAIVTSAGFTAPTAPVAPVVPDVFGLGGSDVQQ